MVKNINTIKLNTMMTAKQTDERVKFLEAEINRLEVRVISATCFAPHKIGYYKEQVDILKYELDMIISPSSKAIDRLNKLQALLNK